MEIDFAPIIENQVRIVAKIQGMALIDLNEKTSEMLETHANLLFDLLDNTMISYEDEDDEGDDETSKKPTPVIDDARY